MVLFALDSQLVPFVLIASWTNNQLVHFVLTVSWFFCPYSQKHCQAESMCQSKGTKSMLGQKEVIGITPPMFNGQCVCQGKWDNVYVRTKGDNVYVRAKGDNVYVKTKGTMCMSR